MKSLPALVSCFVSALCPGKRKNGALVCSALLCFVAIGHSAIVQAQEAVPKYAFRYDQSVRVEQEGKKLANAWAGGLNVGQFSKMHINEDSVEDLVVFDRTNNKLSTFIATAGSDGYYFRYTPEYESQFPELIGWAKLADYDGDGRKDLFAHTNLGIIVYRNISVNGKIRWQIVADPVYTKGLSGLINLQVSVADTPALVDLDNDGDLDILAFSFTGEYINYHQNLSMETYGRPDSLMYKRIGYCWGNFRTSHCGAIEFGIDCGGGGRMAFPGEGLRVNHAGASLLVLDLDGDTHKDILISDIDCNDVMRLNNEGTGPQASFSAFQKGFPIAKPIQFPVFPSLYYEDLDFDGVRDLVASPTVSFNEANQINFRESGWLYRNQGTEALPDFEYRQSDFLQRDMIDLGENAVPAFADYDGDGDQDLFVGNGSNLSLNGTGASITFYENVGSRTQPEFVLITSDYLNLSSLGLSNLKPLFADINRDGSTDMGFTGNKGQKTRLWYIPNQSARTQRFQFEPSDTIGLNLPLQLNDTPYPYDLDGDGDLDWLIGGSQGNLAYFETSGSTNQPVFTLKNDQLGNITAQSANRNLVLVITDFNADGKPDLITGDQSGRLSLYEDIRQKTERAWTPIANLVFNSLEDQFSSCKMGSMIFPAAADLNGDNLPELIVGTNAGGLHYLKNISPLGDYIPDSITALAYPNPVKKYLYIKSSFDGEAACFNTLGQVVTSFLPVSANKEIPMDLSHLANGLYILRVTGQPGENQSLRVVLNKD
jgi:hypothetical protein